MTAEPTALGAAGPGTIPDPYRPLPPDVLASPAPAELPPEQEPNSTGTFFLMMIFLMLIAGFWVIMYFTLLRR